jgi:uncharacterized protein (DUF2384 family)
LRDVKPNAILFAGKHGIGYDMEKHQAGRTASAKKGQKEKTRLKGAHPLKKQARGAVMTIAGVEINDDAFHIVPAALADAWGMSIAALARTVGLPPETLQRTARAEARKTQERLRETAEIIRRVRDWAGGDIQAMAWYRAEPIPAFGGRTAEALVKEGRADAVRDYLDAVANGSFA